MIITVNLYLVLLNWEFNKIFVPLFYLSHCARSDKSFHTSEICHLPSKTTYIQTLYYIYSMYIYFTFQILGNGILFHSSIAYKCLIIHYKSFLESQEHNILIYIYIYICTTVILFYVRLFITISFVFSRWIMGKHQICSLYFARLGWNSSLSLFLFYFFVICFFFFFLCTCDICEMRKKESKRAAFCFFFLFLVSG
jgi:hypothetical protein